MTTNEPGNPSGAPRPDALRRLLDAELSLPARIFHIALLLVSLLMAAAIASLWLTEPSLPLRTHVAFGVMTAMGLAWAAFSLRVLTNRRVLFARHRIVAGRMAVAFTTIFIAGAMAVGYNTSSAAGYLASALGLVMLGVAAAILVRAHQAFAQLDARRQVLERELRTAS